MQPRVGRGAVVELEVRVQGYHPGSVCLMVTFGKMLHLSGSVTFSTGKYRDYIVI